MPGHKPGPQDPSLGPEGTDWPPYAGQTEELSIVEGCLGWRVEQASQAGPVLRLALRCGPLYRLNLQLTHKEGAWQLSMQTSMVPAGMHSHQVPGFAVSHRQGELPAALVAVCRCSIYCCLRP